MLANIWSNFTCAGHIPIYCSYASSRILLERFPGLKPALRVLEEKSTTLLRLASPLGVVNVHVTAYNANHCLVRALSNSSRISKTEVQACARVQSLEIEASRM